MTSTDKNVSAASAEEWTSHVSPALFAMVMGIAGLGLAWRKSHELFGMPVHVGEILLVAAGVVYIAVAALYLVKMARHWSQFMVDFNHPIRSNFLPAASIGLLLLSAAARPHSMAGAEVLFIGGVILHLVLAVRAIARWITHNYEIHHSNPAWFIPVVGNVLVPIPGVPLGYVELSWFFFAVGLVFWIVLFTIIFNRIIFHDQLPEKFVPTLFIMIAPPALGFIAYQALSGGMIDHIARILVYFALFITLLVASMSRRFLKLPFALSWWAYTFPLDAMAIAALIYADAIGDLIWLKVIAGLVLAAATIVVALVFARTLKGLFLGEIFQPE